MTGKEEVQHLVRQLGGPARVAAELARRTGVAITRPAVNQWSRIPGRWVLAVERLAREKRLPYDRHVLRPDLFGPTQARRKAA